MDRSTRILIVARPGHSRQSLVALLKTLPSTELFLAEGAIDPITQPSHSPTPHLVLVDLGGLHPLGSEVLKCVVQQWPTACKMALVDDVRQIERAFALGADYALPHDAPAGELLQAVQRLSHEKHATLRVDLPVPTFVSV
jgi:DNA-binding NarL/FixJ family response regulator